MTGDAPRSRLAAIGAQLWKLADWTACAMFAAVFVIFNYKIVTRYFEHDEAVWADEVLVILFVWIIFWANAFLLRDKQQIVFDLVYRLLPDTTKRYVAIARAALIGGIFAWALPGSLDYIHFLWREHTPSAQSAARLGLCGSFEDIHDRGDRAGLHQRREASRTALARRNLEARGQGVAGTLGSARRFHPRCGAGCPARPVDAGGGLRLSDLDPSGQRRSGRRSDR